MAISDEDLDWGMHFIVGTWQIDYLVNFFSNDLAHIPAKKFKSDDGRDFSSITFEFFEDHKLIMKEAKSGKEEEGTWEQTGSYEFHYTLNNFFNVPESETLKQAETLSITDGMLTFTLGFLAIAMKKIAEGRITEQPDIGAMESDPTMTDIIGDYEVAKTSYYPLGGDDFITKDEGLAILEKQKASEEVDDETYAFYKSNFMMSFNKRVEFAKDGRVNLWQIDDGILDEFKESAGEEAINEAIKAGAIGVKDGYICMYEESKEWKAVDGEYYLNTMESSDNDSYDCDDNGDEGDDSTPQKTVWKKIKFTDDGFMELCWMMADWYLKKL